jgi:hypothetical protein
MTPAKRPAHIALERHGKRLSEATSALREAEATERRAVSAVEVARDAVREAHSLGADAAQPTLALDEANREKLAFKWWSSPIAIASSALCGAGSTGASGDLQAGRRGRLGRTRATCRPTASASSSAAISP